MSETQLDRLGRKIEQARRRAEAEKLAARPLTEDAFESGEHLKNGQVIRPYAPPKKQYVMSDAAMQLLREIREREAAWCASGQLDMRIADHDC